MINLPFFYDFVFPNYILPNALNPQLAIINYIHNLHVGGATTDSLFEKDIDNPKNVNYYVFGDSMGKWPQSLRHNGTHLRYPCYKNIVTINEQSVFLGKQTSKEKYYYPIKSGPHLDEFLGRTHAGLKLNGEYFWRYISREVLDDLKKRRAIIFIDWAHENFVSKDQYEYLHEQLKFSEIPDGQIMFAFNSFNSKEIYENWFNSEERKLDVLNWPFLLFHNSYHYKSQPEKRMELLEFRSTRNKLRDHHGIFKIRRGRPYRLALLFRLCSDDLLDKMDYSMLDNFSLYQSMRLASSFPYEYNEEKISKLHSQFPVNLKTETNKTFLDISGWGDNTAQPSKNAYFDITCETYMEQNGYKSFTEKVSKPLVHFNPFFFVGFQGALALLRELGFKTFSPYIDESYDNEPNQVKRLDMIYAEVKRLLAMSKEEIHNWYWSMEDILQHNHYHFLNFYENDDYTNKMLNYMDQKIKL